MGREMGTTMNRDAYHRLITEDIAWLLQQPATCERDHILAVLNCSTDRIYGKIETTEERAAKEAARQAQLNVCDCWMLGSETRAHCERCNAEEEAERKRNDSKGDKP